MQSVNPFNAEIIAEYKPHQAAEIDCILSQSVTAFAVWKKTTFDERAVLLHHAADLLDENKVEYAKLITDEMGKLHKEAVAEIEKCIWVCRYYAENGERFLKDESLSSEMSQSYVAFLPLGPVLAIMPWNFPFWQVFRFAAPALMAGNVGLLKNASNVTGCALAIESIFVKAASRMSQDIPAIFQTLKVAGKDTAAMINDPRIKAVTLTGSTEAGKAVAETAGRALKKTVLELGGSDPYLILEDADIALSVEKCVTSRLLNAGQSCIAAKRFLVHDAIYEAWLEQFCGLMKQRAMGDPHHSKTTLAPLAQHRFRDELHQQVENTVKQGAECILGGQIPEGAGAFYPPTVLTGVKPSMNAYQEELFGPAAVVYRVKSTEEAIQIANDTPFGLGAGVFSKDIAKAQQIAKYQMEAGSCFVNTFVASHPNLPFGGVKESGFGRELSNFGIKEFVNIKTVAVL